MNEKVAASLWNRSLSFNPWVLFFIFLISNTLLSFYPCPLQTRLFIFLFGLLLPFLAALKTFGGQPVASISSHRSNRDLFPLSPWWTAPFILGVIFSRFYDLTNLPPWLLSDESYPASAGMSLLTQWDGRLLWSPIPYEPVLNWLLAIYFKCLTPSLFSFRLFSSLISLITIGAAYWGTRPFFSKRTSFLFALLFAASYWGFLISRLCNVAILIPLWQCFSFGCLGRLLNAKSTNRRWRAGAGLILFNILGFYSWTNWVGLSLSLILILIIHCWKQPRISKIYLGSFLMISAVTVIPLVLARLAPGGMAHWGDVYHFNFFKGLFYNLVGLFWDGSASFPYGSLWGGFLNPILDSLMVLGVLFFFQQADRFWRWIFPIVVILSFLPSLLASGDVELFRAVPLLVFLTLAAAAGVQCLLKTKSTYWNIFAVLSFLVLSFGMDTFNYTARYADAHFAPEKHQATVMAYAEAYRLLDRLQAQSGPLDVFSAFTTDFNNRTLDIALYPFNALQNPALSPAQPRWAAVMTNVDYVSYFRQTYPQCQVTAFKKYGAASNSPDFIALVIIPLRDIPARNLERWKEADQFFRKANLAWLKKNPSTPWSDFTRSLLPMPESFKKDIFLTTLYWEKIGFLNWLDKNFNGAVQNYQAALQNGYPAAHLYYDLGLSLKAVGKDKEAEKNFLKAARFSRD